MNVFRYLFMTIVILGMDTAVFAEEVSTNLAEGAPDLVAEFTPSMEKADAFKTPSLTRDQDNPYRKDPSKAVEGILERFETLKKEGVISEKKYLDVITVFQQTQEYYTKSNAGDDTAALQAFAPEALPKIEACQALKDKPAQYRECMTAIFPEDILS